MNRCPSFFTSKKKLILFYWKKLHLKSISDLSVKLYKSKNYKVKSIKKSSKTVGATYSILKQTYPDKLNIHWHVHKLFAIVINGEHVMTVIMVKSLQIQ